MQELRVRNEQLYYYALGLMVMGGLFYLLAKLTNVQVDGVNAWYKPTKFALAIAIYCATMAWYCYELPGFNIRYFNRANIVLFTFELVYITVQAARGMRSHYNQSTAVYSALYIAMALAAILITLYAVYVAYLFFVYSFPHLPLYYVWAIRLGLIIFVLFSFQGLIMGSRLSHSVGENVSVSSVPLLKWNCTTGDLRVAHFVGMHALQVLPLLAYYIFKHTHTVFVVGALYLLLSIFTLIQALQAKPFISTHSTHHENINKTSGDT